MLASHHAPSQVQYLSIDESHAGQRMDNYLFSVFRGIPKSRLYRIVRKGEVRVNKRRISVDYRLVCGDIVRIPPLRYTLKEEPAPFAGSKFVKSLEGAILYEDDHLLILNKPAGMAVHGGSGVSLGLIEGLRHIRSKAPFLELVHRLDRDTSGCVMIAKRRAILTHLHDCLQSGKITKHYIALVEGKWKGGKSIKAPLLKYLLPSGERRVKVDPQGKPSETKMHIMTTYPTATLLQATPVTGRTHQIRVHCGFMGNPIVGDQKYGDKHAKQRLFLHAHQLDIPLPYAPFRLQVSCPLPMECQEYLSSLATLS